MFTNYKRKRRVSGRGFGLAHVNLVGREVSSVDCQPGANFVRGLFAGDGRLVRQQAQAGQSATLGFHFVRIGNKAAEHLVAAADAPHRRAVLASVEDPAVEADALQPGQVFQRIFRSRDDDQVRIIVRRLGHVIDVGQ